MPEKTKKEKAKISDALVICGKIKNKERNGKMEGKKAKAKAILEISSSR